MVSERRYLVGFSVELTMERFGYGESAEAAAKFARENLEQALNHFMLLNPDFCSDFTIREKPLHTVDEGVVYD